MSKALRSYAWVGGEEMLNSLRNIGDKMLAALMPRIEAGACVPEHGQVCCGRYACNGVCTF
jgi:hypothetical protein